MKNTLLIVFLWLAALPAFAMTTVDFANQDAELADEVILFISDPETLTGAAEAVNEQTQGQLLAAIKASGFETKMGDSQTFYGLGAFSKVIVIGSDSKTGPLAPAQLQDLGGYAAQALNDKFSGQVSLVADGFGTDVELAAAHLALGFTLRDYQFSKYKKAVDPETLYANVQLVTASPEQNRQLYENDLKYVAEGAYLARDMASEPGKSIYPEVFVDRVRAKFRGVDDVDIDILDVRDMERRNMGALLGVGKGSVHDPRLLVIKYEGADSDQAPIALVGKGITFDTGGISIKPNTNMWMMKSDLSGAAAVAGTMLSIAKRGDKVNVVGLMPLAENMPSGDAIRPGDVLETMQGTTIEILSTDAEGRLILADAVTYAQREFKPKMLLNIATLTGSAARALSDEYAALITRDFELSKQMMEVGKLSGEAVWPLPLHPNHFIQIKSDIADIKNSGAGAPGASIGAAVVGTFVDENLPWVHLDIAGVDHLEKSTATTPKGFAGWGVRFMDTLVREQTK